MSEKEKTAGCSNTPAAYLTQNLSAHDTSAANNRWIVLQALRTGAKTTIQLRHEWGVMAPAPRVLELREEGYRITTIRVPALTADGVKHSNVAKYLLQSEPGA